jgi:hypothetical protein
MIFFFVNHITQSFTKLNALIMICFRFLILLFVIFCMTESLTNLMILMMLYFLGAAATATSPDRLDGR